jgi:hypothetical protein
VPSAAVATAEAAHQEQSLAWLLAEVWNFGGLGASRGCTDDGRPLPPLRAHPQLTTLCHGSRSLGSAIEVHNQVHPTLDFHVQEGRGRRVVEEVEGHEQGEERPHVRWHHGSIASRSCCPHCRRGGMPQKEHMSRVSFIFCNDSIACTSAHKYTFVTLLSNSKFKLLNKRHKDK